MILKSGENWEPEETDVLAWQQAYKEIDIFSELDAMACWCEANPSKRKTKKGVKRFVNAWLQRANQKGGSPFRSEPVEGEALPIRRWTMLDMLTHDFMNSPTFRATMLERHGQYMDAKGVRHVRD
jgi:hypothetical protein